MPRSKVSSLPLTICLPDVTDDLLPVGHEGGRPELEVSLERLLAQPPDRLGGLAGHLEPVSADTAAAGRPG